MRNPDIVIIEPPEVVAEKIRLAEEKDKRPPGVPSLLESLLEDRRLEREREWAEEGW